MTKDKPKITMAKGVYVTVKGLAYLVVLATTLGCLGMFVVPESIGDVEYASPSPTADDDFRDDKMEDIKRPSFDPDLVDSRLLTDYNNWQINTSAAVLRLDVLPIQADEESNLLTLHPSYRAALDSPHPLRTILPSVNLLDGKAKQFDDGLYAALDQAYYRGLNEHLVSHVALVRRLYDQVDKTEPGRGLSRGGPRTGRRWGPWSQSDRKGPLVEQFPGQRTPLQAHRLLHLEQHPGQLFPLPPLLSTAILAE